LLSGGRDLAGIERRAVKRLRQLGFRPDYVAIRNATDLTLPARNAKNLRVLAAAWLGRARLIDNVPVRRR
jgi:pantoate--beta-alanine ligase